MKTIDSSKWSMREYRGHNNMNQPNYLNHTSLRLTVWMPRTSELDGIMIISPVNLALSFQFHYYFCVQKESLWLIYVDDTMTTHKRTCLMCRPE